MTEWYTLVSAEHGEDWGSHPEHAIGSPYLLFVVQRGQGPSCNHCFLLHKAQHTALDRTVRHNEFNK